MVDEARPSFGRGNDRIAHSLQVPGMAEAIAQLEQEADDAPVRQQGFQPAAVRNPPGMIDPEHLPQPPATAVISAAEDVLAKIAELEPMHAEDGSRWLNADQVHALLRRWELS